MPYWTRRRYWAAFRVPFERVRKAIICQNVINCGDLVSAVGAVRELMPKVEALTLRMHLPESSENDRKRHRPTSAGVASVIRRFGMGGSSRLKTIDVERQYIDFYSPWE